MENQQKRRPISSTEYLEMGASHSSRDLPTRQSKHLQNRYVVYLHARKSDGQIFYVGIGSEKRPYDFKDRNKFWRNYVNKYGEPSVTVAFKSLSLPEAQEIERFLISLHRRVADGGTLTNITAGGDSNPMHEESIRSAMSVAMKGRVFSDETIQKMKMSAKGRPPTPQAVAATKAKHAAGWNPMHSDAAKRKVSKYWTGRARSDDQKKKNGIAHSKPVEQLDVNGNVLARFDSQRQAAKAIGCTAALIGMCVGGVTKTAAGFIWRRAHPFADNDNAVALKRHNEK